MSALAIRTKTRSWASGGHLEPVFKGRQAVITAALSKAAKYWLHNRAG